MDKHDTKNISPSSTPANPLNQTAQDPTKRGWWQNFDLDKSNGQISLTLNSDFQRQCPGPYDTYEISPQALKAKGLYVFLLSTKAIGGLSKIRSAKGPFSIHVHRGKGARALPPDQDMHLEPETTSF